MSRKPGLWLPGLRVEAQVVGRAHKKPCEACNHRPVGKRLLTRTGSGKSQKSAVFCVSCGIAFVHRRLEEGIRLIQYLEGENVEVRESAVPGDPHYRDPRTSWLHKGKTVLCGGVSVVFKRLKGKDQAEVIDDGDVIQVSVDKLRRRVRKSE